METTADLDRWCAPEDEQPFLAWIADRASLGTTPTGRHLAPIADVGRLADGRLAVDVLRPTGTPLTAALDVIGALTAGVAVTLSVPLLELAVAARCGAVQIGRAGLDDVIVDDAGAIVLCDRPPGRKAPVTDADGARDGGGSRARGTGAHGTDTSASAPPSAHATPGHATTGHRRSDEPGDRVLLLATRVVWERTDGRDPGRSTIDAALADALDGDADTVRTLLSLVRAHAAPRPVRWEPPASALLFGVAPPVARAEDQGLVALVRTVVVRGVPLGGDRRLPVRQALVGLVVAVGVVAAAVFALG
ncbi:hypothetical protein ACTJKO_11200 [Curtobacterium sp. 22159]|uniref:hypothetical protein n=1 Tax=Curtobacterium sp. 22159 TaxID=3453882 RepID=UPI003F8291C3